MPAQFTPEEYSAIRLIMWLGTAAMLVMNCFPGARIYMSMNAALAIGTGFMAAEMVAVRWPVSEGEGVVLAAPVKGEWLVVQGGVSSLINHHYPIASQRDAIDLVRTLKGRSQLGDKTKLDSFPTWGEKVYSPVAGTIVRADVAHEDNAIGATDRKNLAGNHLVIDMGSGRFVLLAHLQKDSALVKVGDTVREGDALGRCGNSGNSSEPHLHIQVQSKADLFDGDVRTYPILFREVVRTRAGRTLQDGPVTVRRNDRIFSDPGVPR